MTKDMGTGDMEVQIGLTRAQPGNKVWHLERAEHAEGYTVPCHLGGGGAVLFAFTLWSVRWKDDQRGSNRCVLKPQKKTDVPNPCNHCLSVTFLKRILQYIGISVFKHLVLKSE